MVRCILWINMTRRSTCGKKLNISLNMMISGLIVHMQNLRWWVYFANMLYILKRKKVSALSSHYILDKWTLRLGTFGYIYIISFISYLNVINYLSNHSFSDVESGIWVLDCHPQIQQLECHAFIVLVRSEQTEQSL